MRSIVSLFLCVLGPVVAAEPRVDWIDASGEPRWSVSLPTPSSQKSQSLEAEQWFPPLPRVALPLIVESSTPQQLSLETFRGRVLVLDFWASWCAPCLEALPSLQRLVKANEDRGLVGLAVNVDEDDATARRFAVALGLELPLLRLTPGMDALFEIKQLPTTLVIDRRGRVRARFNGSHAGLEVQLAEIVDRLLDGAEVERFPLASVHRGRAGVFWSRQLNGNAQAVAAMPEGASVGRALLGLVGWDVAGLDGEGRVRVNKRAGSGYEALVLSPAGTSGDVGIYAYRRFGKRVAPIEFGPEATPRIEIEEHLLDIRPDGTAGGLWLGTSAGLRRIDSQGRVEWTSDALGAIWGVGPSGSRRPVLAVAEQVAVHWLDDTLTSVEATPVFDGARLLLTDRRSSGFGVASREVVGWSIGNFLDADRLHLALASTHQLHLIDLAHGTVDFEAVWPEIRGLAAYDPAATGQPMLAVASAKRISLIRMGM